MPTGIFSVFRMKELSKVDEILLVAIWRLKDQAYGVRIRRHVSRVLGKEFTYGNLYSALHQLTAKKFVPSFGMRTGNSGSRT